MKEITTACHLIEVASIQGIKLSEREADVILGYLCGHDYTLLDKGNGATTRHDVAARDDHSDDTKYTIAEAILFCSEMNEELLWCDLEDLTGLHEDEAILDSLIERIQSH